jgi:hypothetical protein
MPVYIFYWEDFFNVFSCPQKSTGGKAASAGITGLLVQTVILAGTFFASSGEVITLSNWPKNSDSVLQKDNADTRINNNI